MTTPTPAQQLEEVLAIRENANQETMAYLRECRAFDAAAGDFFRANADTLRRALAALEAVEWKPIETAPKDGQMFFGWVKAIRYGEDDNGQQYDSEVSEHDFCQWRDSEHGGYFENMMGRIGDEQIITHWLPLPAPPADAVEVSRG